MSCAREGASNGIVFTVLREVEKEVVLLDPGTSNPPETPMHIDPPLPGDDGAVAAHVAPVPGPIDEPADISSRVLKVIKKVEVEVLCSQHNPVRFVFFFSASTVLFDVFDVRRSQPLKRRQNRTRFETTS